jgi:hypothetical protein
MLVFCLISGDDEERVGLDLGYPAARGLVRRAAARGRLLITWVPTDPAWPARRETLDLGPDGSRWLADVTARAGERYVDDPIPLGLDSSAWACACRDAPCLVAASHPPGPVLLVVPAALLRGLEDGAGAVRLASAGGARLRITVACPEGVDRAIELAIRTGEQRRLALRLAAQRSVIVMGTGSSPVAGLRVRLTGEGRAVVREVARRARTRSV